MRGTRKHRLPWGWAAGAAGLQEQSQLSPCPPPPPSPPGACAPGAVAAETGAHSAEGRGLRLRMSWGRLWGG